MQMKDMMAPPPVKLPEDPAVAKNPADNDTALAHPDSPLVWALRAEEALKNAENTDEKLIAYALARTGYHRGLDRLRGNGWKGWGSVPYEHEPNQGVLRAIAALALAARAIGEDAEYDRCRALLSDSDPACVTTLLDS
ncbi:DUF3151 domain-containing protein [Corynebacterium occultum]|nr:DUF3151 domain-containing protein [Corynebacterium occultum]